MTRSPRNLDVAFVLIQLIQVAVGRVVVVGQTRNTRCHSAHGERRLGDEFRNERGALSVWPSQNAGMILYEVGAGKRGPGERQPDERFDGCDPAAIATSRRRG